ncbi:YhdP family protein [Colwelliaceae bacterium 6441]
MGISKVSNRWLNRAYKCIAIFLVTFAVLISALRLFLPYAHNYRQNLQDYINASYESNIVIGSLNMGWQSSGPTIEANNVSILRAQGAEVYIDSFNINIDFWKSLRNRRLVTQNFTLDGVKVLFDKKVLAQNSNAEQDAVLIENVSELFLKQIGRFTVNNSQIIYRTETKERTFLISQIDWLNQGNDHKAHGSVILDGLTSNNLQVDLDVTGETLSDMQGKLYLSANQLNITPWLDKVLVIDDENTHSTINFNAWLSIENGLAKKLQLALGQNQIAWQYKENIQTLNIDQGQIVVNHLDAPENLQIYSSKININSNNKTWQPLTFEVNRVNEALQGYVSTINIEGVADLIPLFVEQPDTLSIIKQLNPMGTVNDIYLQLVDNELSSVATFTDFTSQYSEGIPGIQNVSGELVFAEQQLQVSLNAVSGALDFDKHFIAPIRYQSLSSTMHLSLTENSWQLTSEHIDFVSEQIKVSAKLGVFAEQGKDVQMSLLATATDGNAIYAQTFYPHLLMGDDLVNYLKGALQQGKLEQALVLINGPVNSFPYQDGSGTFVVDAELSGATFKFEQNWPAINHFSANLNFTNNSMLITGRDGLLSGIDVRGVKAGIADLTNNQVLTVDAQFNETAPELVKNLMLTSPLDDSVGAVLEQIKIGQNISGDFSLSLPLADTKLALAKGQIHFNNNNITLQTPEMYFAKVGGSLRFENEKITTDNVSLLWRDMPLTLDVNAYDNDQHYQTDIAISAKWQEQAWLAQVPELLKPYADGALNWQGSLAIKNFHDGQFSYQLDIASNLVDTQLNIPQPFAKKIHEEKNANIKVYGNENQSRIDVKIGEQLNFYGNLNHQQVSFTQAHLILGDEPMYLPMRGFHITANLAEAKFEQWQPFVSDIIESLPEPESQTQSIQLLEQPQRIRGKVAKLNFLDESIHGVSFNLADEISWWLLELTSKEARAKVKFYPDWHLQGLDINADFIHLAPEKMLFSHTQDENNAETKSTENKQLTTVTSFDSAFNDKFFSNIPSLQVNCEDCTYGNLNLGKVTFNLQRQSDDVLTLNNFVSQRKNNKLSFDAKWQHNQESSQTTIAGDYNTKDIERELERLGLPSTVKDSGLKSSFDLNWLGGPQNFAIATLNGDISGKLDEGYLAEVPDKARALSILSLQSLVRKLKFDFRDIFSDGMFYSEIKGDFHIQKGVVYTKNTFLKGSAGDLSVKGNTDLNTEILDYKMSYKPNYSASLPAIAWIATLNPVTFLAGIAIDEVITANVYKELKFEVTGDISEPSFKEVDRKTQNISVGRGTPPQIVDNIPDVQTIKSGSINPETGLIEEKVQDNLDKSDG